jgi:biopolymer transport protein ExbB
MSGFTRKALWAGLAVLVANLAFATAASAQDSAGASDFTFFTIWILGGGGVISFLLVFPIQVLSVATLAHVIEHFVTLHRDKLVPPEIVVELETLLDEEKFEEAVNLCAASRNYVTNVVGASIARVSEGYDAMVVAAQGAVEEENLRLVHKISWLSLYGNLGPMLGLFGTVVGMVIAFTQIAQSEVTPSPQKLAHGIFAALVTTVWGLLVAMPALGFFYVFKMRVQRLAFELSNAAFEVVTRFKPAAERRRAP